MIEVKELSKSFTANDGIKKKRITPYECNDSG